MPFKKIKKSSGSNLRKNILKAFRQEVSRDIIQWTKKPENKWEKGFICPVMKVKTKRADAEVDHYPEPFVDLVDRFLDLKDMTTDDVRIYYNHRVQGWELEDPNLTFAWREWHLKNSTLRWISKDGNKKQGASRRRPKPEVVKSKRKTEEEPEEETKQPRKKLEPFFKVDKEMINWAKKILKDAKNHERELKFSAPLAKPDVIEIEEGSSPSIPMPSPPPMSQTSPYLDSDGIWVEPTPVEFFTGEYTITPWTASQSIIPPTGGFGWGSNVK